MDRAWVQAALRSGADVLHQDGRQGRTALMSAAELGDKNMAELLIAAGAGASVDATFTESG